MTEILSAFITLTLMEIVLGVDNIIFIAIQVSSLPRAQQFQARTGGLIIALMFRVILLCSLSWIMGLTAPLFTAFDHTFSGRDLLLLSGGIFLIVKSVSEIHNKVEGVSDTPQKGSAAKNLLKVILQVTLIDIVFSFDSIITAVGMTQQIPVMIAAVVAAMIVMIFASGKISDFIERHATIKILALAFLLTIGVMLFMDGMGVHVERGYLYFAMAFALGVEVLNMRHRKKKK